jgi:hypothetical protein
MIKPRTFTVLTSLVLITTLLISACSQKNNDSSVLIKTPIPTTSTTESLIEDDLIIDIPPTGDLTLLDSMPAPQPRSELEPLGDEFDENLLLNPEDKPVSNPEGQPIGFKLPLGAEVTDSTKFDGNDSFISLLFSSNWQDTTKQVRTSLENEGWTCTICIPFKPAEGSDLTPVASIRYTLEMERKGREVFIVISVAEKGSAASYTFQG